MKAKKIQYILKRPLAFLLICALLLPTMILAQAALTTPPDVAAPDVKVVSTLIGGQYLEVGLNIDNKEAGTTFQSAGVLLSYDPKVLIPVKWDKEATIINLVPIDPANAATAGEKATILPTKGADVLSGKLAEAFVLNGKGYLYLSAEAARTMSLRQTLPAKPGPIVAPSGQKPFPTETAKGKIPISYLWEAGTATEQATVLRFVLKAKPEQALYDYAEIVEALDVVVVDESTRDIVESMPLANPSSPLTYIADNTDFTTAGYDKAVNLQFVWILDGQTVNSGGGGGDASNFASIVFYDWDDTLLGATTVGKDATEVEIKKTMEMFAATQMAPADKQDSYGYYAGKDADLGTKYPLTFKKAYRFEGVWLNQQSDAFECYKDDKITYDREPASHLLATDYTAEQLPNYADIKTKGVLNVKAAYKAEANANTSGNFYYKCEGFSFNRYGATRATNGNFGVTLKVSREFAARLYRPAIKTQMQPASGAAIWSLTPLGRADVETVEIVPTREIATATVNVIDQYNNFELVSNWTGADVKSGNAAFANKVGADPCFVVEGTIGFVNEQARLEIAKVSDPTITTEWNRANQVAFTDIGLVHKTKLADSQQSIINAMKKDSTYFNKVKLQAAIDTEPPIK